MRRKTVNSFGQLVVPDLVSNMYPLIDTTAAWMKRVVDAVILFLTLEGFPAIVTRFHLQTLSSFSHPRSAAYTYEKKDARKALEWVTSVSTALPLLHGFTSLLGSFT